MLYAEKENSKAVSILQSVCDFLCVHDSPSPCDLIFVLAGRQDRKPYGLNLFRQGFAPRLIVSVSRSEVRATAALLNLPELLTLRDSLPPGQRHFWVDVSAGRADISPAHLRKSNTYWELEGLARYLGEDRPLRITIISTSIHLQRISYCCSRISFFRGTKPFFVPVPEETSCFRTQHWWQRREDASYVLSEHLKLAAYRILY